MKSLSVKTFLVIAMLVMGSLVVITYNNAEYLKAILENNFRTSAMETLDRKGLVLEGNLTRYEDEMPRLITNYVSSRGDKQLIDIKNQLLNSDSAITHIQLFEQTDKSLKNLLYMAKPEIKTKKREFILNNIRVISERIKEQTTFNQIFERNQGDSRYVILSRPYKFNETTFWALIGLDINSLNDFIKVNKNTSSFVFDKDFNSITKQNTKSAYSLKKPGVKKLIESDVGSGFAGQVKSPNGETWNSAYYRSQLYGFILLLEQDASVLDDYIWSMAVLSAKWSSFILLLALFVAFYASRGLVLNLNRLTNATQVIASGHFAEPINVQSKDEIGVLANSVRWMAHKIQILLESEKEKVRYEQEIATANTVQNTFFQDEKSENGPLRLSSFYTPASECGGEWEVIIFQKVLNSF